MQGTDRNNFQNQRILSENQVLAGKTLFHILAFRYTENKTTMDFEKDVIEKSKEIPVLVDFWAPWCGPCRVLGPVLDQLAEEQSDKWKLVKINTEVEQELARSFKVMSIPNVKLFHNGAVIGEFMGALPKNRIEAWLSENIPTELNLHVQAIESNQDLSSTEKARQLEAVLDVYPNDDTVRLALAKQLVFHEPEKAKLTVADFKMGNPEFPTVQMIRDLSEFMLVVPTDESPFDQDIYRAQHALREGDMELGVKTLIDITSIDKSFQNELPRRATIGLFQLLGNKHDVTRTYRKMFDMVLW